MTAEYEHVIIGGGLAGGLLALALAEAGRGAGVALVEQDARLGGNHTWSFHQTDLHPEEAALVAPLVSARWPRHAVRFPGFERTFHGGQGQGQGGAGYCSIASAHFAEVLTPRLRAAGVDVILGQPVNTVGAASVGLADQTRVRGRCILDARGPDPRVPAAPSGGTAYQKFVGLELELDADGPWTSPLLMDADVAQVDGYRFVYVLPYTRRRVLVEDTIYSRNPGLDPRVGAERVMAYAHQAGASVGGVLRREMGVLPLPLREATAPRMTSFPVAVGYRGGFLHPVTGYSLPIAARVALAVAAARTGPETLSALQKITRELASQRSFGRLLNRLMFDAMPPAGRWTALARFYRLPEATIARFYGSRSTLRDRARILLGRPPAGLDWKSLFGARRDESQLEVS